MRVALATAIAIAALAPAAAARSPFEWRGVVEGAYGPPWDHAARVRMLHWMGAHGFNAYVHAPKNDPWQRANWRDPYPAGQQADFDREIALARSVGVQWIPNLSPALPLFPSPPAPGEAPSRDLCFSCPQDLQAVMRKLEPFYRAGARTFMISFDDVSKAMSHPEDVARYGAGDEAFGRANGDFLSRLYAAYGARVRLLTVGADYSGTQDTAYLRGLRATLRPEVHVMWTGTGVPASAWSPADARAYGRAIARTPLVWENWTNDDSSGNAIPSGTARIFLGPYRRRADVAGAVGGFFFNPANEADLNMLPLATAARWLRAPRRYTARRDWLRAVRGLAARRRSVFQALRAWAETSYSTKLDPTEAPTFSRRRDRFLAAYAGALWRRAERALLRELGLVIGAPKALARLRNRAFAREAAPFLASAHDAATAGKLGTRLLGAERPALVVRRAARGFRGRAAPPDPDRASMLRSDYGEAKVRVRSNPRLTYGWRGGIAFDVPPSSAPPNRMDVFFDRIDALDDAWQPKAEQAASSVRVTLGGRRVRLARDGTFTLSRRACGRLLVATDGAGGRTALRLPRCRR